MGLGLGLFSFVIESVVLAIETIIIWFNDDSKTKRFVDNKEVDNSFFDFLLKPFGNTSGVKHIVGDNHDGTHTVITQVTYKGDIIHEWNETAKTRFLSEMKKDHKRDGKEYLRNYKLKK